MTTRREFFKLVAGAALAPVAAKAAAILPEIPILWGDGIHDDAPALQALIDGGVVEFADPKMAEGVGWFNGNLRLPQATMKIGKTIRLGPEFSYKRLESLSVRASEGVDVAVRVDGAEFASIGYLAIDTGPDGHKPDHTLYFNCKVQP